MIPKWKSGSENTPLSPENKPDDLGIVAESDINLDIATYAHLEDGAFAEVCVRVISLVLRAAGVSPDKSNTAAYSLVHEHDVASVVKLGQLLDDDELAPLLGLVGLEFEDAVRTSQTVSRLCATYYSQ